MFKPNLNSGWKTATSCIYRAGLSASRFELLGNSSFSLQIEATSCVHSCSQASGTESNWGWENQNWWALKSTCVLLNSNYGFCQAACFGWAASCKAIRTISFSAAQLRDEVDTSETPCSHCMESVCSWTVSLMGCELSNICVYTWSTSVQLCNVCRGSQRCLVALF